MIRQSRTSAAFSKISAKGQTVIPRAVRKKLALKPGDTLRYRVTDGGVLLDKAPVAELNTFAAFSEWAGEADDKAYRGL